MNRHHDTSRFAAQRGLTLVEIMVAITLGLILTAVVIQVFLSNRRSYAFNDNYARLQESARVAMQLLSDDIRVAGFRGTLIAAPVPGSILGTDGGGAVSDSLTVSYVSPGGMTSCAGNAVPPGGTVLHTYAIAPDALTGRNALFCTDGIVAAPGVELVPDVQAMQLLFGIDTDRDSRRSADIYLAPAAVVNPRTVSVRLGLLFSSERLVADTNNATVYSLLGVNTGPFNDRRLYVPVSTTVQLRNCLMPSLQSDC